MSLASKAAKGGTVMLSGQIAKVSLQFLNLILLARLLQPEDFGLVAMVIAIYGVCDILLDFGLSTASIQAKNITKGQISNLFWINFITGLFLSALAFSLSSLIADFYGRVELVKIAQCISIVFLMNGIAAQYKAQLNRNFKFLEMVKVDLIAMSVSILAGVYAAYTGYSYWAIIIQQITQAFLQMLLYIIYGRWVPSWPNRSETVSSFIKFGWGLAGSQILGYFSRNIPSILIGQNLGASQLGFFDRANKMLMLPLNQLNAPSSTVAVPILSRLEFEDRTKYNQFLLFGQNIIVHLVVLSLALANCQTDYIVTFVIGDQWLDIVPVFRALSFAGVFLALSYASYWVFLSKGITGSLFKLGLVGRPIQILITSVGLVGGVVGVAYAYSFALMVSWLLGVFWLRKTGIPAIKMVVNPLAISIIYFTSAYISNFIINQFEYVNFSAIIVSWSLMLIILSIAYLLIPVFKKSVNQVFEVKIYLRKKNETY